MTAFFIPGLSSNQRLTEEAYVGMRDQLERDLGRRPTARRIVQLWTRRGSTDCITEVGLSDPLHGGTVMAIFDMGSHQPFVVWRRPDGPREDVREVLGCNAYSVLEFD